MNTERFRGRPPRRPEYRAKLSGLRIRVLGRDQILQCEPVIALRPLSRQSDLYGIFYDATGQRLAPHGYCLRDAKAHAESLFRERLSEWEELKPCSIR